MDINPYLNRVRVFRPRAIRWPNHVSEFELQSELFTTLKQLGFRVRGEVAGCKSAGRKTRLDIVIFDQDNRAVLVIEVKRAFVDTIRRHKISEINRTKKQADRYIKTHELPVLVARGPEGVKNALLKIQTEMTYLLEEQTLTIESA